MTAAPPLWVYIDETGDRGSSDSSSPIFGMAALLVSEDGVEPLRAAIDTLRQAFGVPDDKHMSWKDHVKTHDRRRKAAEVLGGVTGIKVCYVYATKNKLDTDSDKSDRVRFYNFVAKMTYFSLLWAARDWKGGRALVSTRFGHVRHHDHRVTEEYLTREAAKDSRVPNHMEQDLRWVSAGQYPESQAADLFAGFLKAAIWPSGEFDFTEPSYLQTVWHLIRGSERCAIPLGMLSMPTNDIAGNADWLPCQNCPQGTNDGPSGASGRRST